MNVYEVGIAVTGKPVKDLGFGYDYINVFADTEEEASNFCNKLEGINSFSINRCFTAKEFIEKKFLNKDHA